jgi:hypothetical protein
MKTTEMVILKPLVPHSFMPCGIVGSAMMAEASATADAPKQQQTWHQRTRHRCDNLLPELHRG